MRRRLKILALIALVSIAATLALGTSTALMKTGARVQGVAIPIQATTTISNVVIDLSDIADPKVKADVSAIITLMDPATGSPIKDQNIVIEGVDFTKFALDSAPASDFFANAAAAAKTALESHGINITDIIIEKISLRQNEDGGLDGVNIQVNANAALEAEGNNDPVGEAILGEVVPDGTVLWETRIRVVLDGNNYTALDPTTTAMKPYIANILNNLSLLNITLPEAP